MELRRITPAAVASATGLQPHQTDRSVSHILPWRLQTSSHMSSSNLVSARMAYLRPPAKTANSHRACEMMSAAVTCPHVAVRVRIRARARIRVKVQHGNYLKTKIKLNESSTLTGETPGKQKVTGGTIHSNTPQNVSVRGTALCVPSPAPSQRGRSPAAGLPPALHRRRAPEASARVRCVPTSAQHAHAHAHAPAPRRQPRTARVGAPARPSTVPERVM